MPQCGQDVGTSLDFVIIRFLMKLFNANNLEVCQKYFAVQLPSILWSKRVSGFEKMFSDCSNSFFGKISAFVR